MTDLDEFFLAHFGVKGMKWGVRKTQQERTTAALVKSDARWEKGAKSARTQYKVIVAAEKQLKGDMKELKAKPEYAGVNLRKDKVKSEKYYAEVADKFNVRLQEQADAYGTNFTGTKKLNYKYDPETQNIVDSLVDVEHADLPRPKFKAEVDTNGFIIDIVLIEDAVAQAESIIENYLAHFGVKGMKWGVRKDRTPTVATLKETPGKRLKTSGGKFQDASSDAKSAALVRQKARASTVDSLSNAELKALNERMNLEQNFNRLNAQDVAGRKNPVVAAVTKMLLQTGQQEAQKAISAQASSQVADLLAKKSA